MSDPEVIMLLIEPGNLLENDSRIIRSQEGALFRRGHFRIIHQGQDFEPSPEEGPQLQPNLQIGKIIHLPRNPESWRKANRRESLAGCPSK